MQLGVVVGAVVVVGQMIAAAVAVESGAIAVVAVAPSVDVLQLQLVGGEELHTER